MKEFRWPYRFHDEKNISFSEKPFIVLEFSKKKEGPYEDADPFPYDMPDIDFEQEIKFSLGIK